MDNNNFLNLPKSKISTNELIQIQRGSVLYCPPKNTSFMLNSIEAEALTECTVFYKEKNQKATICHKIRFNSPHTKEAAAQLGITFQDCLPK